MEEGLEAGVGEGKLSSSRLLRYGFYSQSSAKLKQPGVRYQQIVTKQRDKCKSEYDWN